MTGGVKGTTRCRPAGAGQQQCWQAMRILRRFTAPQLLVTCPLLGVSGLRRYLQRLQHCGYVVCNTTKPSGVAGVANALVLVRNTGPLAPLARSGSVSMYDPNTGETWGKGGELLTAQAQAPLQQTTSTMRRWLVLLAQGRRPHLALPDPENGGAASAVLKALGKRDLVDQAGALTAAGRELARASQQEVE